MKRTIRLVASRLILVLMVLVLSADSLVSGVVGLADVLAYAQRARSRHFTHSPMAPYLGENPGRDEDRSSWWTPRLRANLRQVELRRSLEAGVLVASMTGSGLQSGGGGEEGSGGGGGGEEDEEGGGSGGQSTEGLSGLTNTNTGNNLSRLPLAFWESRGDSVVDLTLYHNSVGTFAGLFGAGWSSSYEVRVDHSAGVSAIVRLADGLNLPYTENLGTFSPPAGVHHDLVRHSNGTWSMTRTDQSKYEFNTSGKLVAIKDRNGNTVTVTRDGNQRITSVMCPSGRSLTFAYNGSGLVSSVTDPTNRVWTFAYNGSGQLTGVTYPTLGGQSHTRSFSYDSAHNILTETDLRGNVWTWTYDSQDRMTSWKNPLNQTTSFSYGSTATIITRPGGQQIVHNYSSGLLASAVDEASFSQSFTYDSNRNVLTKTDERGKVWTYTYDSKGNVLTAKNPLNQTWTLTYTTKNDVATVKSPLNHTTTYTYDTAGNLTQVADPLGRASIRHTYDSYGQVLTSKDALDRTTAFSYDTHGRVVGATPPNGHVWSLYYDGLSRLTEVYNPFDDGTIIERDAWGRVVSITHPDEESVSRSYDLEGNLTAVTDELNRTTTFAYDTAGRRTSLTNPRGDVEQFGYNSNGWLTSITNGRGHVRTYTYTARGEAASLTLPDSTVEQWSYLGTGEVSRYTSPLSYFIDYEFDDAGRLVLVDYPTGTDTTFTYDASSRRTQMVDSTGTTTWTYNAANEVTDFDSPQGNIDYTYNTAGQIATYVNSGVGTTSYSYDSAGRVSSLTNPHSETTSVLYDEADRPIKKTFASGQYESYGYDIRSRVVSAVLKNSGHTTLRSQSYTFDVASQITGHTLDGVATTYGYDAAGQLTSESRSGYSASYTYDANGNRATRTVNGVTETYTNDSADKLTSVTWSGGSKSFGYDAAGRTTSVTTSAGTTTLAYDYESRVTGITYPNAATNSFAYNGLDTRVSKVDSSGTATYRRLGAGVTAPVVGDGFATFTPGVSERRSGTTRFQHSGIKNADAQSLTNQTVTASRAYDAFGNVAASSGTMNGPFGYGGPFGYQSDADSGLKLLGHRYYDSSTGRFLTRDPAKDGRNWYGYCYNNPVSMADPNGEFPLVLVIVVALVIIDVIDTANDVREIIDEPSNPENYIMVAVGMIDPTPGNGGKRIIKGIHHGVKRRHPQTIRNEWERNTGRKWPTEPNGRRYQIDHDIPLADGGVDDWTNVTPRPRDEHIKRHVDNGDFKRWGGLRYQ